MVESAPAVIVLGGPNGAGKTTASRTLLADTLNVLTFVNADVIAQGLSGFNPASAAVEAGRIMLQRVPTLAAERANFAFETTLSGRWYAGWLQGLKGSGYTVHLVYFWLQTADLAVARVAERVRVGGHNIPEPTVRRRYRRSVENFFRLYRPAVNTWRIYDTSEPGSYRLVAHGGETSHDTILVEPRWQQMQQEASR